MSSPRILAIDPGIEKVGYAVFESTPAKRHTFIASGLIKTPKTKFIELRIKQIIDELTTIIEKHTVNTMVMEQLFFFKNAKTVIQVAQAQGAIISLAASHNLTFSFLTPLQIKQIVTGDGRADKTAVWKMLKLELGGELEVADDDESDAIAAGFAYCIVQSTLISSSPT